jgi:hypothetical protein
MGWCADTRALPRCVCHDGSCRLRPLASGARRMATFTPRARSRRPHDGDDPERSPRAPAPVSEGRRYILRHRLHGTPAWRTHGGDARRDLRCGPAWSRRITASSNGGQCPHGHGRDAGSRVCAFVAGRHDRALRMAVAGRANRSGRPRLLSGQVLVARMCRSLRDATVG